jgi:hypothetical protein
VSMTPDPAQRTHRNPADVPSPPDATQVDSGWDDDGERHFWGTERGGVLLHGFQKTDGHVRARWVCIGHACIDDVTGEMTAADARKLGCSLIAAADELDRLEAEPINNCDPSVVDA